MLNLKQTVLSSMVIAALGVSAPVLANNHGADNHPMDRTTTTPMVKTDRTVGEAIDDASITASIKTSLLADELIQGFDINVDTTDGRVSLKGGTDSQAAKARAGDIARTADRVIAVDNQLVVAAEGTAEREQANTATASGAVRDASGETGDVIDDSWITTKVKSQLLADSGISGFDINVETIDNTVHLIGNVSTVNERASAVRLARNTQGVRYVNAERLLLTTKEPM